MKYMITSQPDSMHYLVDQATKAVRNSKKALAISHIDADGISALSIVITMLQREGIETTWRNIHQLNSETILEVVDLIQENNPDLVIFSDLGTGQMSLILEHVLPFAGVGYVVVLDHHLPSEERSDFSSILDDDRLIEINPCQHGLSGSYDLSGSGVAFLLAYALSEANVDLSEIAIVGATGDLQDYYGKGFKGINRDIMELGKEAGYILVEKDLTFFGINTRPLPYLLEYATEPYLPGITGNREHCFDFLNELGIELKDDNDSWRTWTDLVPDEKQTIIQALFSHILETYDNPKIATGIVGDVVTLLKRPERTEMRTAKEFSTLLNACGRNRRPEIGVEICLSDEQAFRIGKALLQQHRANLAGALRRLETDGYLEEDGMYVVRDPETPDTIIGIVIGMAQGSRIVPINKPIIGVSTNTTGDGPLVKISGRARRDLVKRGVNLKEAFVAVGQEMNERYESQVVEAGGHPMAAGAFVHTDYLEEFLRLVSSQLAEVLK
ncbi:MAG: DHH family phosphoesterase [Candidatus Thorarchaeota archaeon]|nr:DHH family phosphoesterase [Candidatus Thorarchaeota archaeon]